MIHETLMYYATLLMVLGREHLLLSSHMIISKCSVSAAATNRQQNLSGDEIANVNFHHDDIVHALQNTINSCINSATDQRGYVLVHRFTKFGEITQCNGHFAV